MSAHHGEGRYVLFAAVLQRALQARLTVRLVFSSPHHEGVIMVDLVEGQIAQVTGSWGSGKAELRRLLDWRRGRVIFRPVPEAVLRGRSGHEGEDPLAVSLDAEFASFREESTVLDVPIHAHLRLLTDAIRGLPETLLYGIYDETRVLWASWEPLAGGVLTPREDLEASFRSALQWMQQHNVRFLWTHATAGTVMFTRVFAPPHALALLGTLELNVPYIRQLIRTLHKESNP